jgi:hypothetical protein
MPQNTIADFINTIIPDYPYIICPACGTPMGIPQSGSFEMVLTINAQNELNNILSLYRRFLHGIERELTIRNQRGLNIERAENGYPYRDRKENKLHQALHNTRYARGLSEDLEHYLDFHTWHQLFHDKFPTLEILNSPSGQVADSKDLEFVIKNLLCGIEPDVQVGYVVDVLFDQDNIIRWIQDVQLDILNPNNATGTSRELHQLVKSVCPYTYDYLMKIRDAARSSTKVGSYDSKDLLARLTRCMYILALLLGHEENQCERLSRYLLRPGVTLDFPRLTVVSPRRLIQLLTSRTITMRYKKLQLSDELINLLISLDTSTEEEQEAPDGVGDEARQAEITRQDEFIRIANTELTRLVNFVCTGPSGSLPPKEVPQRQPGELYYQEKDQCGWFPKERETHPVVLMGSPGTGKSTVMMAGLTTFCDVASAIGTKISFISNADRKISGQYAQEYWNGNLPEATLEGSRRSIQLTVERVDDKTSQVHFVFTDIPGEVAARGLKGEGSHPIVLDVLQHTETIVFFFDLSIEPSIRKVLVNNQYNVQHNVWKHVQENFEETSKERLVQGKEAQNLEMSKANVSQLQLLSTFIDDLRAVRRESSAEINFICVIPKADLYGAEHFTENGSEETSTHFLTDFYQSLHREKVLIPSLYTASANGSLQNYRSIGGTGSTFLKDSQLESIQAQINIAKSITQKAIQGLEQIGRALGPRDADVHQADRDALNNIIQYQLLKVLNANFPNFYVLPVSPQGEQYKVSDAPAPLQPETNGQTKKTLRRPPNQKLSEYVFLLPVALAMCDDHQQGNHHEA